MDNAHWKSRILFLILRDMFDPPEALLSHTLSKSCYLIHELFPTNHLSFQELVNFGTPCHPFPSLNTTNYLASNLTSINLILSPYLLNFPFFLFRGIAIGFMAFPRYYLLKKTKKENLRNQPISYIKAGRNSIHLHC